MTRVAITGAGIVTPIAQTPAELHEALCRGVGSPGPLPEYAASGLTCNLGRVVDPGVLAEALSGRPSSTIDKTGQLAIVAAQRAIAACSLATAAPPELGLVLGTMFSGAHTIGEFDRRALTCGPEFASPLDFANTVLNAAAGQTAIRLALRGINSTIAGGHASGLQAIGYATDLVAADRAGALLAGGAEELCLESYVGFCRSGVLCGTNGRPGHVPVPFDANRTGFALGEGAAFVLIESACRAESRGVRVLAEIAGVASVVDPDAILRGFCARSVIAEGIRRALCRAGVAPEEIDAVSAAANGSYAADAEEAAGLAEVFGGCAALPPVTAIKSVLGETLGSAGPLQVVAMVEAMRDGRLPGICGLRDPGDCFAAGSFASRTRSVRIRFALVTAVSPEGGCCALVLRAPGADR